jgi:chromosome segregation ATPase
MEKEISTYLNLLEESLVKKSAVLSEVQDLNKEADVMLKAEELDLEAFDKNMDKKGELAAKLDGLDDGFDAVYGKIREEVLGHPEEYKTQVKRIQNLIREITDKQTSIQAQEVRLKKAVEAHSSRISGELKVRRNTTTAAQNYYQAMNKLGSSIPPQFMDRKK